ncbi:MAG: 3-dehydroquinate synthase [Nitrospira sp.]|nr:3-dehydroquinate synthase [Nitrospira sp.]
MVQRELHKYHIDRHSFVLTIGGGAVLDMSGFAAATTHRGVRNIRLPTTLLSQADGGLGVKTGVNGFGVKNFIGTFTAPFAVVNDFDLLASLPSRHLTSGMAEAVKVALIRDKDFFEWVERNAIPLREHKSTQLHELIRKSASIHLQHIALCGDPFESGCSRPLDFGHWAAHKLESLTSYRVHHGEAVAIGMAIDSQYSAEIGLLSRHELLRALSLIEGLGLRTWHTALERVGVGGRLDILQGLEEFQEHIGGKLTLTLLKGIGQGVETDTVRTQIVIRALGLLKKRHSSRCAST